MTECNYKPETKEEASLQAKKQKHSRIMAYIALAIAAGLAVFGGFAWLTLDATAFAALSDFLIWAIAFFISITGGFVGVSTWASKR